MHQDGATLQEARRNENQAIRDRRTASRIGRVRNIAYAPPVIDLTDGADDVVMTGFATLNSVPQQGRAEPGLGPTGPRRSQRIATADSRNVFNSQPAEAAPDRVTILGVHKTCVHAAKRSLIFWPCMRPAAMITARIVPK